MSEIDLMTVLLGVSVVALCAQRGAERAGVLRHLRGWVLAAVVIASGGIPDLVWAATLIGFVGAIVLAFPRVQFVAQACAGAVAGFWCLLLQAIGAPLPVAMLVAAVPMVATEVLSVRRPGFSSGRLRQDALLILVLSTVVAAAAPIVQSGWRTAMSLQQSPGQLVAPPILPAWVLAIVAVCLLAGVMSVVWRR